MPELPGRFGQIAPAIGAYALLYEVPTGTKMIFGIDVCNSSGEDAHIKIWVVPDPPGWTTGEPGGSGAIYRVAWNQRIEADATDGNVWVAPIKHLEPLDKVIVWTDKLGVTFYGHGFQYTG